MAGVLGLCEIWGFNLINLFVFAFLLRRKPVKVLKTFSQFLPPIIQFSFFSDPASIRYLLDNNADPHFARDYVRVLTSRESVPVLISSREGRTCLHGDDEDLDHGTLVCGGLGLFVCVVALFVPLVSICHIQHCGSMPYQF